ncbi:MAG: hypothetical protein Q8R57_09165 [Bacteroidota bacterium]|nr:hypothetical protein [Bacteroidota bacterium]
MYQNLLPLWRTNEELMITAWEGLGITNNNNLRRNSYVKGSRHYELSNHTSTLLSAGLGNVLAIVNDRKIEVDERYSFSVEGGYKYENGANHLDAALNFAGNLLGGGMGLDKFAKRLSGSIFSSTTNSLIRRGAAGVIQGTFDGIWQYDINEGKDEILKGYHNLYNFFHPILLNTVDVKPKTSEQINKELNDKLIKQVYPEVQNKLPND